MDLDDDTQPRSSENGLDDIDIDSADGQPPDRRWDDKQRRYVDVQYMEYTAYGKTYKMEAPIYDDARGTARLSPLPKDFPLYNPDPSARVPVSELPPPLIPERRPSLRPISEAQLLDDTPYSDVSSPGLSEPMGLLGRSSSVPGIALGRSVHDDVYAEPTTPTDATKSRRVVKRRSASQIAPGEMTQEAFQQMCDFLNIREWRDTFDDHKGRQDITVSCPVFYNIGGTLHGTKVPVLDAKLRPPGGVSASFMRQVLRTIEPSDILEIYKRVGMDRLDLDNRQQSVDTLIREKNPDLRNAQPKAHPFWIKARKHVSPSKPEMASDIHLYLIEEAGIGALFRNKETRTILSVCPDASPQTSGVRLTVLAWCILIFRHLWKVIEKHEQRLDSSSGVFSEPDTWRERTAALEQQVDGLNQQVADLTKEIECLHIINNGLRNVNVTYKIALQEYETNAA